MRRRWKAFVVVAAVALFASLLFLLPPRDDGLDWIRKYGGKETVQRAWSVYEPRSVGMEGWWRIDRRDIPAYYNHTFQFRQLTADQIDTIINHNNIPEIVLTRVDQSSVVVAFQRKWQPSWFEDRWSDLKDWLGWEQASTPGYPVSRSDVVKIK
jgi:hypothetical protein